MGGGGGCLIMFICDTVTMFVLKTRHRFDICNIAKGQQSTSEDNKSAPR